MSVADGIVIRPYRDGDAPQLIGLVRELQDHEAKLFDRMRLAAGMDEAYVSHLLKECGEKDGALLVAERQGALVGYATVLARVANQDAPDEVPYSYALVGDLAVTAPMRGRGVGRRLLEECELKARAAGARWLRVNALAANDRALNLYRRFGFDDLLIELEKPLAD